MKKLNRKEALVGKNKMVGFAWVGRWLNENIGWGIPETLYGHRDQTGFPSYEPLPEGEELSLCKITIEVVGAKNGRKITRLFGKGEG